MVIPITTRTETRRISASDQSPSAKYNAAPTTSRRSMGSRTTSAAIAQTSRARPLGSSFAPCRASRRFASASLSPVRKRLWRDTLTARQPCKFADSFEQISVRSRRTAPARWPRSVASEWDRRMRRRHPRSARFAPHAAKDIGSSPDSLPELALVGGSGKQPDAHVPEAGKNLLTIFHAGVTCPRGHRIVLPEADRESEEVAFGKPGDGKLLFRVWEPDAARKVPLI